jgi:hypothetical protein
MPKSLTDAERAKVESKRKSTRPKVYDPSSGSAQTISKDFEAWLILSDKSVKQTTIKQIKTLRDSEADSDFQDLFTITCDNEKDSLDQEISDLSGQTSAFTEWRSEPGISGWQDVAEVGWMLQELQQGLNPIAEKEDATHFDLLRAGALQRLLTSKDSEARRETRLKALIAVLNAY